MRKPRNGAPFRLRCLRPLKLSMEPLSFFLSPFMTELGLLESERHVGVHVGAEVLDGRGVVEGLAMLVRTTESVVEVVQLLQLVWFSYDYSGREAFKEF
jgi:hypothetical protein